MKGALGSRPTDEEKSAIVAELEAAGLLATGFDADGGETWTLTHEGIQVAHQMAMSGEDGALELIAGLLDALP
jgi:hypothetical protein